MANDVDIRQRPLRRYVFPTTGTNGTAPDSNFYGVESSGDINVTIQSNKISFKKTSAAFGCGRIVMRDGAGSPRTLKNADITMDVEYVAQIGPTAGTFCLSVRQQSISAWRGSAWYEYPCCSDGYSIWGWEGDTNRTFLNRRILGDGSSLQEVWGFDPTVGQTWRYRFRADGRVIQAKRWLTSSAEPAGWQGTIVDTSNYYTNGYLSFGMGEEESATGELRVSNITVTDMDPVQGPARLRRTRYAV